MENQLIASQLDADGNTIKYRQVGWFVGFIRQVEKVITLTFLELKTGGG